MESEQQQSYEEKKAEREERKASAKRAHTQKKIVKRSVGTLVIIGIVAAVIFGIILLGRGGEPEGEDFSRAIPLDGAGHIPVGSPLAAYSSDPPTSGPHYGQTARSGFREEAIPDQHLIHNLEHGDVWISYNPRIAPAVVEELKQFAGAKVIITPREANEFDIALAAWGRLDAFNLEGDIVPAGRISDFIKRYTNKAPEFVPGASGGV